MQVFDALGGLEAAAGGAVPETAISDLVSLISTASGTING
jgi:hypothetical protein